MLFKDKNETRKFNIVIFTRKPILEKGTLSEQVIFNNGLLDTIFFNQVPEYADYILSTFIKSSIIRFKAFIDTMKIYIKAKSTVFKNSDII